MAKFKTLSVCHMDGKTDGRTTWKQYTPRKHRLRVGGGGYNQDKIILVWVCFTAWWYTKKTPSKRCHIRSNFEFLAQIHLAWHLIPGIGIWQQVSGIVVFSGYPSKHWHWKIHLKSNISNQAIKRSGHASKFTHCFEEAKFILHCSQDFGDEGSGGTPKTFNLIPAVFPQRHFKGPKSLDQVPTFREPRTKDRRLRHTGNSINIQLRFKQAALALAQGRDSYKITQMSHLMTKPTKLLCTRRRLGSAWASASAVRMKKAWVLNYPLSTSKDSDQTGRMPRLIWVFAGCIVILLVLSRGGSNNFKTVNTGTPDMNHLTRKPTKWVLRPAKTQISLGIRPVWSESSLSAQRKIESLATHWAHSEDSDQTGRMPFCWFCHETAQISLKL